MTKLTLIAHRPPEGSQCIRGCGDTTLKRETEKSRVKVAFKDWVLGFYLYDVSCLAGAAAWHLSEPWWWIGTAARGGPESVVIGRRLGLGGRQAEHKSRRSSQQRQPKMPTRDPGPWLPSIRLHLQFLWCFKVCATHVSVERWLAEFCSKLSLRYPAIYDMYVLLHVHYTLYMCICRINNLTFTVGPGTVWTISQEDQHDEAYKGRNEWAATATWQANKHEAQGNHALPRKRERKEERARKHDGQPSDERSWHWC